MERNYTLKYDKITMENKCKWCKHEKQSNTQNGSSQYLYVKIMLLSCLDALVEQ